VDPEIGRATAGWVDRPRPASADCLISHRTQNAQLTLYQHPTRRAVEITGVGPPTPNDQGISPGHCQ